jgi:type II secretory pathway predicted ATPase ExeA
LTFRVFVSSTFSDFIAERNALQEKVFPRLRDHCRQHGARFQAIDLRWGVGQESALDQQTMTICLSELRRCQLLSPRPNFIVLLGQRYGWRPLPPQIEAREFDALLARCDNSDRARLLCWYRRDENALPPEYALLQRANEWADSTRWAAEEAHLLQVLAHAAEGALSAGKPARGKYEESATHQETHHGLFDTPGAADHAFAYFRTIQGLPEDESASAYRDLHERDQGDEPLADRIAAGRLAALKVQLKAALPQDHVFEYEGQWQDSAPRLELDEFCRRVERDLRDVIDREVEAFQQESDLDRESRAHSQFARERAEHFHGRQDVLGRVRRYLKDDDRLPLVVTGPPGSGKTAVLGRAWLDLPAEGDIVGVARFIGATPPSADLRSLLAGLCSQFDAECGTAGQIPTNLTELAQAFEARLWSLPADRQVILFLDALDQLNPSDDAHSLHWLPRRELPPQVKLVLSVADVSSGGQCFEVLQRRLADRLIPLAPFPATDGKALLDSWLRQAGRTLQPGQQEAVLHAFASCPFPLYLKLAFEEVRRWKSYDDLPTQPDGRRGLASTISGLVTDLFHRLERPEQHGTVLPGRSLSLLAAARRGLTEEELLGALSANEDVMRDFRLRALDSPAVDRLPGVVWSRLFAELEPYLSLRSFDGVQLLSFYHRQIGEAVGTHYLGDDARRASHAALADYFSGQPYSLPLPEGRAPGVATRVAAVNRRVVDELPWHLAQAVGREGSFLERLELALTDLRFIEAKCLAGKVYDLAADYARALQASAACAVGEGGREERADRLKFYAAALAEYAGRHRPQPVPGKRKGTAADPAPPPPPGTGRGPFHSPAGANPPRRVRRVRLGDVPRSS